VFNNLTVTLPSDPGAPLSGYQLGLCSDPEGTTLVSGFSWVPLGVAKSSYEFDYSAGYTVGVPVYWAVKALNAAGLTNISVADGIIIDKCVGSPGNRGVECRICLASHNNINK
jgi:hypothetical protein